MNSQVGTLKCPNCGGEAKPDSVRCAWCGSSLATVACPACFGAMFVGMKHCPLCGAEVSREEQAGQAVGLCPRCHMKMVSVKIGKSHLNECRQCGGLWVDKSSFEQICEEREAVLGLVTPAPDKTESKTTPGSGRMYVPCPACGDLMNRVNFGCSGVVIDWCKEHGTWFDSDELRRVVAFIRGGGLRKSREREKEKLQQEVRRLRQEEFKLAAERHRHPGASPLSHHWSEDHEPLLNFLSAVWKGLGD